jgi:hypothetical protein
MRSIIVTLLLLATPFAFAQNHPTPPADASAHYRSEVMAAARRDVLPIHVCYDQAPRHFWRQLNAMTLSLDATGAVTDVRLAPATTITSHFRDCLLPIVRAWHLSAPETHASVSISYPMQEIRAAVEQIAH